MFEIAISQKKIEKKICLLKIFSLHLQQLTLIAIKPKAYRRALLQQKIKFKSNGKYH